MLAVHERSFERGEVRYDFPKYSPHGGFGRADIAISNGNVSAIVEVKVEQYCGLTDNQPNGYLSYLAKERAAD